MHTLDWRGWNEKCLALPAGKKQSQYQRGSVTGENGHGLKMKRRSFWEFRTQFLDIGKENAGPAIVKMMGLNCGTLSMWYSVCVNHLTVRRLPTTPNPSKASMAR